MDSADQRVPAFLSAVQRREYSCLWERDTSYYVDQVNDYKMSGGWRTRARKEKFVNTSITHTKPS